MGSRGWRKAGLREHRLNHLQPQAPGPLGPSVSSAPPWPSPWPATAACSFPHSASQTASGTWWDPLTVHLLYVPLNDVDALAPAPADGTLFGNTVFADEAKARSLGWVSVLPTVSL